MSTPQYYRSFLLQAALQYADRGWRVFALAPRSKSPRRGSHGYLDATTDEAQITEWWAEGIHWNLAIATGKDSNLVVLDIDLRNGGDASLHELERHYGLLPDTVRTDTAGGWHLYFTHPGGDVPSDFGDGYPGLDIKADGGYVVAPPSTHPEGHQYQWAFSPEDIEIAELPEKWRGLLRQRHGPDASVPHDATSHSAPPNDYDAAKGEPNGGASPNDRETTKEGPNRDTAPPGDEGPLSGPRTPPPLTPGERHKALVSLAGRLVNAGLGGVEQVQSALRA